MALLELERATKRRLLTFQDYAVLSGRSLGSILQRPRYLVELVTQADIIGVGSLPIVILTGGFTGAVLALQTASSLQQFGATAFTGQVCQHVDGQGAWPGHHQPYGLRAQCVRHGQ